MPKVSSSGQRTSKRRRTFLGFLARLMVQVAPNVAPPETLELTSIAQLHGVFRIASPRPAGLVMGACTREMRPSSGVIGPNWAWEGASCRRLYNRKTLRAFGFEPYRYSRLAARRAACVV